jgi:peptide/nickel transport system ATP-binding protein
VSNVSTDLVGQVRSADTAPTPVLSAQGLGKQYRLRGHGQHGVVRAVEDVTFSLWEGKVTAVVGESGSGKSTIARMLARLTSPTHGRILLGGNDAGKVRVKAYRHIVQMVFQDPFSSLNPLHDVRHHIERPLRNYERMSRREDIDRAIGELLLRVKLDPQFADKLPHELSGGQRQRVAIARALAANPKVVLADEPVSMLDVSIRLGILNLLGDLRDTEGLALLYVTHDIASARYFADTILVMYAGRVVEAGPSLAVTDSPAHPYTQLLLSSAPDPERVGDLPVTVASSGAPNLDSSDVGCPFRARCPFVMAICEQRPPDVTVGSGHTAACWLHAEGAPTKPSADREVVGS